MPESEVTASVIQVKSTIDRAIAYAKAEIHRVVAYAVTEGAGLFTLAHVRATTLEHEITVAGAAAIAALVNKLRSEKILP
jgi:multidrug transporter EmrE-like cation transporter